MPAPLLGAIPWILGALAGGTLTAWATASDDEWKDPTVFNARMRDIQLGILQLNNLFSQCATLDPNVKTGWKDFVTLWSAYYRDVGTVRFYTDSDEIQESKRFADNLSKWLYLYSQSCGPLPVGMMPPTVPTSPYTSITLPKPTNWGAIALTGVAILTGGYILSTVLSAKLRPPHGY